MVRWYHAIFTGYGFWLPNDPRGSWSTFVGAWELFKFGGSATKTHERRSLARDQHDNELRRDVKRALKYLPARFDEHMRTAIARGIERACAESRICVHACAIGYDHVHAIVARHTKSIESIVGQFKGRATQQMRADGCHPMEQFAASGESPPTPWAEYCWSVFINDESQLRCAVDYVGRHPMKEGLAQQNWSFVKPVHA